jgi:hypothetical protein
MFGGAAVVRGNLTPSATASRAVLEALDKRFHDALQLACAL